MNILNLFRKKITIGDKPFNHFEFDIDGVSNKRKQQLEDRRYEQDVADVAYNDFKQYLKQDEIIINGKNYGKLGMIVHSPIRAIYMGYDEKTAKYKNTNFYDLVRQKYNDYKKEICSQ